MERVFCKDKKNFCECLEDCRKCEFAKGHGVISGYIAHDVLTTLFGTDYDLERIAELAQADREGRCVVLPCKPSNVTVYQLRNKKHARGRGVSPRHVGCAMVWTGGHYALEHGGEKPCRDVDFGKTWFLTNEEARKALEEMEGE